MAGEVEAALATGDEALRAANWQAARAAFEAALAEVETPEALHGLSTALWWLGDIGEALSRAERAYGGFRRRGDHAKAAAIALRLCIRYRSNLGNTTASRGWLARAARLVDEHGLEPLRGWLALVRAYDGEDDPIQGEAWAREARERARAAGDLELELHALSQIGAALVDQGRVAEGVPLLDEAMAGALGGEGSPDVVVFTSCHMIIACSRCAEFERAVHWVRAADGFIHRYGCPFLFALCRTLYGGVLLATGDWHRAELELNAAIQASRRSLGALHAEALATLAELRLAQGRIEEAERLVSGLEDHPGAVRVLAGIHLARGRPAPAAAITRRHLEGTGEDLLASAPLLELLGEAEIVQGRPRSAAGRGRALVALGEGVGCAVIVARGERLEGRARFAEGDSEGSRRALETALAGFVSLGMPLEAARTRALLAGALRDDHPGVAVAEARVALAAFEALGAARDADACAALLRGLGVKAARAGPRGAGTLTMREREVLGLVAEGLSNPEIAARLHLSRRTVEHHVGHVLSKLGLRNRAEAAAHMVRATVADVAPDR